MDLSGTPSSKPLVHPLEISIEQISCAPFGLVILSREGNTYTLCYADSEPVCLHRCQ